MLWNYNQHFKMRSSIADQVLYFHLILKTNQKFNYSYSAKQTSLKFELNLISM